MKSLLSVSATFCATLAFAGVYDDCQYLFRGGYNYTTASGQSAESVQDTEAPNALALGQGVAADTNKIYIAGTRDFFVHETTDIVTPLTGRVLKNRSVLHLLQPTYRNPGDETLYGYGNTYYFHLPFTSDFANAYAIHIRYKHDGKITPESMESWLFDFGYNWSGGCGVKLSLRGEDDNQWLYIYQGNSYATEYKGTQASEATKLQAGKWTDLLITRGPSPDTTGSWKGMEIYTCREGGTLCKQQAYTVSASSDMTKRQFSLSWHDGMAYSVTATNTAATAIADRFRGSIAQISLWNRKLTEEEVREVFANGYGQDDLVRIGVDNDSALEFTARNELTQTDVTETDADQSTDWRYFNATLAAGKTATVRFSAGADELVRNRKLVLKTTGDSCAAATVSAMLNGTALGEDVGLVAGGMATVDVPWTALKVGGNVLTLTRTDAGAEPLKIDSLHLGDGEAVADEPQVVAGDVYSGAWGWWRHPVAANSGTAFEANEYPNALLAKSAFAGDPTQTWTLEAPTGNYELHKLSVTCPASGLTYEDEPCVYFRNPTWAESGTGKLRSYFGAIRQDVFPITNAASYAIMARVKVEEVPGGENVDLFDLGYSYSNDSGVGVLLHNTLDDVNNMRVNVWVGKGATTCEATQKGDVRDRLGVGKWMDFAIVVSNGYMRLYTYVEGGTRLVEQNVGNVSDRAVSLPTYSRIRLGMGVDGGSSGAYGYSKALKGWLHASALWPRALNRDEVLLAMQWPRPDVVRLGVADKTDREFADGTVSAFAAQANGDFAAASPKTIGPGDGYEVTFDLPADQRNRNQLVRVSAIDTDVAQPIGVSINGLVVTNYSAAGVASCRFAPDDAGLYEIGISRKWLKDGANTVTVFTDADAPGVIRVDSLVVGNGGKHVPVRTGEGLTVIIR